MQGHFTRIATTLQVAIGPPDKEGNAVPPVIVGCLHPPHSSIVSLCGKSILAKTCTSAAAIVCHEDQDRIFGQPALCEELIQPPHVFIDVGDHAVKIADLSQVSVGFSIIFRHVVRTMRRIGWKIE